MPVDYRYHPLQFSSQIMTMDIDRSIAIDDLLAAADFAQDDPPVLLFDTNGHQCLSTFPNAAPIALQANLETIVAIIESSDFDKLRSPQWMGIINVTPDSFSDGGLNDSQEALSQNVQDLLEGGASILDIGGQTTRPGATVIDEATEWARVKPALSQVQAILAAWPFAVKLSVDTYLPLIAERAINAGVDMINDVSGLDNANMRALIPQYPHVQWVAMHHLGLPSNRDITLPVDLSPRELIDHINQWAHDLYTQLDQEGLEPAKLYLDPGIGFGKTPLQNRALLAYIDALSVQYQWLIGHSRKSYLNDLLDHPSTEQRDHGTIGATIGLVSQGCEIIRVHNVAANALAVDAWLSTQDSAQ